MKLLLLTVLLATTLIAPPGNAGIVITSPAQGTVIQRNQNNLGHMPVSGTFTLPYDRVEARLVPLPGSGSSPEPWVQMTTPARQGVFYGSIAAKGGWYKLEIRGSRLNAPTDTASVLPVGFGEVFLIAGHSNAMGLPNLGAKDAPDRVVSYNALNKYLNNENITVAPDLPMPAGTFEPLKAQNRIFPSGESAWYWGELGSRLVARLGVPVLFTNAGWAAANSVNWRESAEGKNTRNIYVGKDWPNRQPYSNLINTLRYYHSWLGIRAVLWFHGENDAVHLKISREDYYRNIRQMIGRARDDFGYPLGWVPALCTVSFNSPDPYPPVLEAQMQLADSPGFNAWRGPYTDSIQVPRPEHGHFENVRGGTQGLSEVAQAWNRSLSDDFFAQRPGYSPLAALFTGVVPRSASPGQSFPVPYQVLESPPVGTPVEAHLLDAAGNFLGLVGAGTQSPLRITLPAALPAADGYRLRVVAQHPTLTGGTSEPFAVQKGLATPQVIRSLEAGISENRVDLHALAAPDPTTIRITVERSDDRHSFRALGTIPVAADHRSSYLYSYPDTQPSPHTAYYRLRLEGANGNVQYSPLLAVFRGESPPPLMAFPNPAAPGEPIYLRTDLPGPFTCQLLDLRGKALPAELADSGIVGLSVLRVPVSLAPGLYFLKILRENELRVQRIMVR